MKLALLLLGLSAGAATLSWSPRTLELPVISYAVWASLDGDDWELVQTVAGTNAVIAEDVGRRQFMVIAELQGGYHQIIPEADVRYTVTAPHPAHLPPRAPRFTAEPP